MVCYQCDGPTQVFNSRLQKRLNHVWRRRRCILCDASYTTTESIDYAKSILINNATGKLSVFSGERLFLSLHASLAHRPSAISDAAALRDTIIAKAVRNAANGVLKVSQLQQTALVALERFDSLAARHYAAMHKL